MLNKTLSFVLIFVLIATTNFSILAQTISSSFKNFQQSQTISKKDFFNSTDRANELLDKDSFVKVKKDGFTAKAMQDADKAQQKKKFAGIGTTAAIVIGVALAAAIIIVFATKNKREETSPSRCDFPPYCNF